MPDQSPGGPGPEWPRVFVMVEGSPHFLERVRIMIYR